MSKLTILLVFVLVFPTVALGQLENTLGFWFDEAGTIDRVTTTQAYGGVTGYLILVNPSHSTGVDSWECVVEPVTEGPDPIISWTLSGQALNAAQVPAFRVGLGTPLPSDGDVLLATASIYVPEAGQKVAFHVLPQDPPSLQDPPGYGYPVHAPLYGAGSTLVSLTPASGCIGQASAVINDDGIDPVFNLYSVSVLNVGTPFEPQSRTTTITNRGERTIGGTLRIEGEGYRYQHQGLAVTTDPTWFRLYPGANLNVTVYFEPTGLDINPGRLLLETCEGTREIELATTQPFPICRVEPPVLDLGPTDLQVWLYGEFTIHNDGDADLEVNIQVAEPGFTLWYSGAHTVRPGSFMINRVYFGAPYVGLHEALVTFGEGSGCAGIPVSAYVVDSDPGCRASVDRLYFGSVTVGETALQSFQIMNTAEEAAVGNVVLPAGSEGFRITQGEGPFTLAQYESLQVGVEFQPTANGEFSSELLLGTACGNIPVRGFGLVEEVLCTVAVDTLDFGTIEVGPYPTMSVRVTNDGNVPIIIEPTTLNSKFYPFLPSYPTPLAPGASLSVVVALEAYETGVFEGVLSIGPEACSDVVLRGTVVPSTAHLDKIGIYFDENYLENVVSDVPAGEFAAYLVLKESRATGGITGWQTCVLTVGGNEITGWNLAGDLATNATEPPCFDVSLGSPLPTGDAVVLMTIDLLVYNEITPTDFYLEAHPSTPIPNSLVYWDADAPGEPITMRTSTGSSWVAQINQSPVPVELPSPVAATGVGEVTLTWNYTGDQADGFHVWRRIADGPAERLTSEPLAGIGGGYRFTDRPQVFGPSQLVYACAAIKDGVEVGRGAEVTIDFVGRALPAAMTLMPNYPNPFNPMTTVPFELAKPGRVRLAVFDLAGRQIKVLADGEYGMGYHEETWTGMDDRGRRAPSGAYYLRLESGGEVRMRQMMLLK